MSIDPIKPEHHNVEHAPVVIHPHQQEDETILERWLRVGLAAGPIFWGGLVGAIGLIAAVGVALSVYSTPDPKLAQSWTQLALANDAESQLKVAEEFPNTPAARWAKIRAAAERFNEAVDKFPTDRDAAVALLTKSMELYEEVASGPTKNPETTAAALGMARVLETRGELDQAIAQCDKVIATWPDSDEAREAERLAKLLKKPSSRAFYKQLYTYVPVKSKFPGGGIDGLPGFMRPMLPGVDKIPPVFEDDPKTPKKDAPADTEKTSVKDGEKIEKSLPGDVFAPSPDAEAKPVDKPAAKNEDPKPKK